jgi:hypothetical protein
MAEGEGETSYASNSKHQVRKQYLKINMNIESWTHVLRYINFFYKEHVPNIADCLKTMVGDFSKYLFI